MDISYFRMKDRRIDPMDQTRLGQSLMYLQEERANKIEDQYDIFEDNICSKKRRLLEEQQSHHRSERIRDIGCGTTGMFRRKRSRMGDPTLKCIDDERDIKEERKIESIDLILLRRRRSRNIAVNKVKKQLERILEQELCNTL